MSKNSWLYEDKIIFFSGGGGGGLYLEGRSEGAPSGSPNLYTISLI